MTRSPIDSLVGKVVDLQKGESAVEAKKSGRLADSLSSVLRSQSFRLTR